MLWRVGDFELDEQKFELRLRGMPVLVQRKALELIFHLARHHDRLVTRDELCILLWDGNIVSEAAIAHAIKLARRALGDDGDRQRMIRTVRGKGLRFVGTVRKEALRSALR